MSDDISKLTDAELVEAEKVNALAKWISLYWPIPRAWLEAALAAKKGN